MSSESSLPDLSEWRQFLFRALAVLAAGAFLSAITCFIAYNWNAMGVVIKFALLELGFAALGLGAWRFGLERWQGQTALFMAFFLIGPFLAVYGQAYPSGAPLSTLLFTWGAVAALGALSTGSQALWMQALAVLNGAFFAWAPLDQGFWGFGTHVTKWAVVGLADLGLWMLALNLPGWLKHELPRRLLIFSASFFFNAAFVLQVLLLSKRNSAALYAFELFVYLLGLTLYAFRRRRLFELVLASLGALSLVNTLVLRNLSGSGGLLGLTLLNLLMGGLMVVGLNQCHRQWKEAA